MKIVKATNKNEPVVNQQLLDFFISCVERTKTGEILSCIIAIDSSESYELTNQGMFLEQAIALADRLRHGLQLEWDDQS